MRDVNYCQSHCSFSAHNSLILIGVSCLYKLSVWVSTVGIEPEPQAELRSCKTLLFLEEPNRFMPVGLLSLHHTHTHTTQLLSDPSLSPLNDTHTLYFLTPFSHLLTHTCNNIMEGCNVKLSRECCLDFWCAAFDLCSLVIETLEEGVPVWETERESKSKERLKTQERS